jgi:hypothetical protein
MRLFLEIVGLIFFWCGLALYACAFVSASKSRTDEIQRRRDGRDQSLDRSDE